MCVGSRPGVVSQIEARMIRIFVDYDRIGIPEPIGDIRKILGSNAKVRAPEPKSIRTAAFETEDMARSEAQCKASVFPRAIHVIASIVTAPIVTHPLAVIMNVWNLWMPLEIAEIALIAAPLVSAPLLSGALIRLTLVGSTLFWRALLDRGLPLFGPPLLWSSLRRSRSTRRNISAANATLPTLTSPVTPAIIPTALSPVPLLRKAVKRHAQRQHGEK